MNEITEHKLANKQAIRLEWLAAGGDCSIVVSNPGLGQTIFTESDTGVCVEVFDETETENILSAISKYEKRGYTLQN